MHVGLNGVESFLLQLIGGNLVHQSNAASFLLHVDQHAAPLLLNHLHGLVQLFAAVAAQRTEDVAGGARRVHTHHDGLAFAPFALAQCEMLQTVAHLTEGYEVEMSVGGGHLHFVAHLHERVLAQPVGDEVLDGDDAQLVSVGKLQQLRHACHGAVVVHNLYECSGGRESCQTAKVDGGLGVSASLEHSVFLCVERIHVSGPAEGLRCRRRVGQCAYGGRTVVG